MDTPSLFFSAIPVLSLAGGSLIWLGRLQGKINEHDRSLPRIEAKLDKVMEFLMEHPRG